jgi:hypothetical protein
MMSIKEDLEKVLMGLDKIGGVEGSCIASKDGLLIATNISDERHAETIAAMSATMLGAAETAANELKKGVPDKVIVETKEGKIVASGAGPKALLVVMANSEARLGLMLMEMVKAIEKIKVVIRV